MQKSKTQIVAAMVQLDCIESGCSFKTQDLPFEHADKLLNKHLDRQHPKSSSSPGENNAENEDSKVIQLSCAHRNCSYKTQPLPEDQAQRMLRKHVNRSHPDDDDKDRFHPGSEMKDKIPPGSEMKDRIPPGSEMKDRIPPCSDMKDRSNLGNSMEDKDRANLGKENKDQSHSIVSNKDRIHSAEDSTSNHVGDIEDRSHSGDKSNRDTTVADTSDSTLQGETHETNGNLATDDSGR